MPGEIAQSPSSNLDRLASPQDPHKFRGKAKTKSNKAGRVGPKVRTEMGWNPRTTR